MYERIKALCDKNNISINKLETELGFAKGYLCKIDNHKPNVEKVKKLANYFNVSVNYLITGEQDILIETLPTVSEQHLRLMKYFDLLNQNDKENILNLLQSLTLNSHKKISDNEIDYYAKINDMIINDVKNND